MTHHLSQNANLLTRSVKHLFGIVRVTRTEINDFCSILFAGLLVDTSSHDGRDASTMLKIYGKFIGNVLA